MELYDRTIRVMGECPFILVLSPVKHDTQQQRFVVSLDKNILGLGQERSVLKSPPVRKSILSSHPETLKLYDHRL